MVLFGRTTPAPLEVTAKDPAVPLEAEAKDPSGSNSHCSARLSGIAVDTRPAPPILVFTVVFIFCPSRAPHGQALQDGSAGSAVCGAFPQGMTGFGFFGISVSLPEPWCEVTQPDPGVPGVYFPLKSSQSKKIPIFSLQDPPWALPAFSILGFWDFGIYSSTKHLTLPQNPVSS